MRRPVEHLGLGRLHGAEELLPQAVGRELDGRQWILDLVRQAARHLAPGGIALRLQERRDVVEHDDEAAGAVLARQGRAGTHQYAPAPLTLEPELLAPLALPRLEVPAAGRRKLCEQRAAGAGFAERLADDVLDLGPEDRAGGLVRSADRAVGLHRDDARGQARED